MARTSAESQFTPRAATPGWKCATVCHRVAKATSRCTPAESEATGSGSTNAGGSVAVGAGAGGAVTGGVLAGRVLTGLVLTGLVLAGGAAVAGTEPSGVTLKKPLQPAARTSTMSTHDAVNGRISMRTRRGVEFGTILHNLPHPTMTERLYYSDSYLTSFSAAVTAIDADGRRVYLDRTAFYPTSGGQPNDLGTLNGISVVDVIDEDDRIAHVLASPLGVASSDAVQGTVDIDRRFDHMQQHTGQHLLSALFADRYGWPTVSVHFGDESSTVDIAGIGLDVDLLQRVEAQANALIVANRDVTVSFEDSAAAGSLRKTSDRTGMLRVVTIADLDRSACGGTHVRRTGEIGGMLLRRGERTKGNTRVEFLCGMRAVTRARTDALLLAQAARVFSASPEELPSLVERQQQRVVELDREHRKLAAAVAAFEARERWSATPPDVDGMRRIHLAHTGTAVREMEPLALALTALGRCLVLISVESPAGVLLATSADSGVDAGQTLRAALTAAGGKGGGSPRVAQGGLPNTHALLSLTLALGFSP